jgi:hypothetical protein
MLRVDISWIESSTQKRSRNEPKSGTKNFANQSMLGRVKATEHGDKKEI